MRKACRTRPSSPPAPSSVLTRYTRSAALRPLPCSHTAPRAASRRTATSCAIRLTRSPARATSSWPPPSRWSPHSWALTRLPAPPKSASSPTKPPTRACWPPTSSARPSTMSSPVPCCSPTPPRLPTRCRRASSTACRVPSTPSVSTRRCPAPSLPSC